MTAVGDDADDGQRRHRDDDLLTAIARFARVDDAEAMARVLVAAGIPALPRIERASWWEHGENGSMVMQVSVVVPVHLVEAAHAALDAARDARTRPEGSATMAEIEAALAAPQEPLSPTAKDHVFARVDRIGKRALRWLLLLLLAAAILYSWWRR